jgi:hypothetical protein
MSSYVSDILEAANKDIKTIMAHAGNNYLRNLMESAYLSDKKFILPEGDPPYKEQTLHKSQLAGAFWQVARKLDVFRRADVKSLMREKSFIGALESVCAEDAKILLAIKDQKLERIYPALTYGALRDVGYFKG